MPKIIVKVNPDGTTKVDFEGYEGPSCLEADDKLRERLASLGVQVKETVFIPKPELNAAQETQQHSHQQSEEA